jgi:hypothetical protein
VASQEGKAAADKVSSKKDLKAKKKRDLGTLAEEALIRDKMEEGQGGLGQRVGRGDGREKAKGK